jgi:pimeloyl-ACP methyl ester carboxylesterase
MAADTAALIEGLGVKPVPVVGFSLGALITQELALARPDLVSAAVLIGSLGRKDLVRRRLAQDAARAVTTPEPRLPSPVERALQLFGPATLGNDEWMERYLEAGEQPPTVTPGLIGQQSASSSYDNRLDALRGINLPCLVVSFELDVLVPTALGHELAAAIPGSDYRCIEGCGHRGLWERPYEANTAIIEFLHQTAATA